MTEFLKGWGSLIIGTLALSQPWLIKLWERIFRRGLIDIHETGTIEIGYSAFGATIGLHGTLRALYKDQFVRSINLALIKQKDSSRHVLDWGVFRTEKLNIGGNQEMSLELPSGFMLTTTQPHRYNILFFDVSIQAEIRSHLEKLREAWTKAVLDAGGRQLLEQDVDLAAISAEIQQGLNKLYNDFSKTPAHTNVFTELDRLCYWTPGTYSLEMRVYTSRPERSFTRNWTFEISQAEFESVRLNALKVVQDTCGRSYGQYNFAYTKYKA